jgi:hypothetical protein
MHRRSTVWRQIIHWPRLPTLRYAGELIETVFCHRRHEYIWLRPKFNQNIPRKHWKLVCNSQPREFVWSLRAVTSVNHPQGLISWGFCSRGSSHTYTIARGLCGWRPCRVLCKWGPSSSSSGGCALVVVSGPSLYTIPSSPSLPLHNT